MREGGGGAARPVACATGAAGARPVEGAAGARPIEGTARTLAGTFEVLPEGSG